MSQLKSNQKLKQIDPNQAGFALLEVMVALFIVGVSLLLFQATSNSLILSREGRFREVALRIADKKLQTIRTTPFATIPASGSFSDSLLSTIPSGQGNLVVSNVNTTLKNVAVTVSWVSTNGTTQQVELQTYVATGGLGQ